MERSKQDRVLSIFFRALRGEDLFVRSLADEYGISVKSITRDVNDIKAFFADNRELVGNCELKYSYQRKCYHLYMDDFLSNKELLSIVEVMIGARAFSKIEVLQLVGKLKRFTSTEDRSLLESIVQNELYYYSEVKHDCESVSDSVWQLAHCIQEKKEISIDYYRQDRTLVAHRLRPASLMFSDFYFYLIAFPVDGNLEKPLYFRVDRIRHITIHRKKNTLHSTPSFNEGELRKRSLYMWPGKLRTIKFEYSGPSVQAVLDKLPTAKIIDCTEGKHIIEAEIYGDGIKMWILSQGKWIKVLGPNDFVSEVSEEIAQMQSYYCT